MSSFAILKIFFCSKLSSFGEKHCRVGSSCFQFTTLLDTSLLEISRRSFWLNPGTGSMGKIFICCGGSWENTLVLCFCLLSLLNITGILALVSSLSESLSCNWGSVSPKLLLALMVCLGISRGLFGYNALKLKQTRGICNLLIQKTAGAHSTDSFSFD